MIGIRSELQQSLLPTGDAPTAPRRLLILSCSARKFPAVRPIPAIERYDGPAFRIFRRFAEVARLNGNRRPNLLVISAKHGLVDEEDKLPNYDQRLTTGDVPILKSRVMSKLARLPRDYEQVLISTSAIYEGVTAGIEDCFPPGTSVARTSGPRGKQLAQLRNWLEGKPLGLYLPQHHFPRRGIARLQGVERSLTTEQVLVLARRWLEEDRHSATRPPGRFIDRYVLIDGERVAPKWLVGRIFDLPVSAFETPDARRVLEQLGITVHKIAESP